MKIKTQAEIVKGIRFGANISMATKTFRTKKDKARTRRALKLRLAKEGW